MAGGAHELAPHHLPGFLPAADGSDPLMTAMLAVLIIGVVLLGTLYLHLHSLPERLAHKEGRVQFELIAVLCLLALFTHNTFFWVAALLLAFVQIPDFTTPLGAIANSLNRIANRYGAEIGGGMAPNEARQAHDRLEEKEIPDLGEKAAKPVVDSSKIKVG